MTIGTNATIVVCAAIIGTAVIAPGLLRERQLKSLRTTCWSDEARTSSHELASNMFQKQIRDYLKAEKSTITGAEVAASTSVRLTGFHVIKVDPDAQTAGCGALVSFAYKRNDGKTLRSSGSVLEFATLPAATGLSVSIAQVEVFKQIIQSSKLDEELP